MSKPNHTFVNSLKEIQARLNVTKTIKIGEIFEILAGRGYAALLILLSFPFCLPIQIPGFSTPFGLILVFLGLRIAFGQKPWWPKWVLNKELSAESMSKLIDKLLYWLQKNKWMIFRPRLTFLSQSPFFHRLNGLLICILGFFLSLPLPIPMTNLLSAVPIFCLGLGLLEDDGVLILIAYTLAAIGLGIFLLLFFWGKAYFTH